MPCRGLDHRICVEFQGGLPKWGLDEKAVLRPKGLFGPGFLKQTGPDERAQDLRVEAAHHLIVAWKGAGLWFAEQDLSQVGASCAVLSLDVEDVEVDASVVRDFGTDGRLMSERIWLIWLV